MTGAVDRCVITHTVDPERPRRAWRGYLCRGCYAHLERLLAETPAVVDDLGVHIPQPPTTVRLSSFLLAHHDWLAHRPEVDEYHEQLVDAVAQSKRATSPGYSRRIDLGSCDDIVACDVTSHAEQRCPGLLRAVVTDSGLVPDVVCTDCGTAHPPSEFRQLARRLRAGQDSWLTTAQVSSLLHVPSGTVRRWAVEDGWRRLDRTERTPTRWHADDVQATYDSRQRTPTREDVRDTRRGA
jgi:hypothetical protein